MWGLFPGWGPRERSVYCDLFAVGACSEDEANAIPFRANSQEESNANKVLFLLTVRLVLATKVSTLPPAGQGWTSVSRSIVLQG